MDIQGQVIVITGGAVRLGRSIAISLAKAGADVCIHYRTSKDQAEETINQIEDLGCKAVAVQADLTDSVSSSRMIIQEAIEYFGKVDILINNASVFEEEQFGEISEEHWDHHFSVNLKSAFFLSQELVQQQEFLKRGHIINIADWRGTRPRQDHLVYTMTKSALITMTKSLALELAPKIQVNAIAPGAILPPPGESKNYLDKIAGKIPLNRTGNPDEIANAVQYLLQSEFITGEILHVSGGQQL